MTLGERIKELRKERLNKTLEQFGERIKLGKSALSAIENNQRGVTDQTILTICREFGVREEWLRDGDGDPFVKLSRDDEIEGFVGEILREKPEAFRRRFVATMAALSVEEWEMIEKILKELFEGRKEAEQASPSAAAPSPDTLTPDEQELLRQYRERKNQEGRSSASAAS